MDWIALGRMTVQFFIIKLPNMNLVWALLYSVSWHV